MHFSPIFHAPISSLSCTKNRISFQFYLRSICLANLLQADLHSNWTVTTRVTCATFAPLCTVVSLSALIGPTAWSGCDSVWLVICVCGSRDSSIKCQNKNEIKSNSFLGILSLSPALRIRHVAKQHLSIHSDCSCCSCCCCCLVASERCRKPLNKFNLTASNMQLKRGMQHAALWQEKEENAWHFICLRERRRPWKSNFPRWQ